jgi:hypothetical protein
LGKHRQRAIAILVLIAASGSSRSSGGGSSSSGGSVGEGPSLTQHQLQLCRLAKELKWWNRRGEGGGEEKEQGKGGGGGGEGDGGSGNRALLNKEIKNYRKIDGVKKDKTEIQTGS